MRLVQMEIVVLLPPPPPPPAHGPYINEHGALKVTTDRRQAKYSEITCALPTCSGNSPKRSVPESNRDLAGTKAADMQPTVMKERLTLPQ